MSERSELKRSVAIAFAGREFLFFSCGHYAIPCASVLLLPQLSGGVKLCKAMK